MVRPTHDRWEVLGVIPRVDPVPFCADAEMSASVSRATPLMERTVCPRCHHLHRDVLAKPQGGRRVACACCKF